MLIESRQPDELLEGRWAHALHITKAHVIADERQNLLGVIIRKTQTLTDRLGHSDSDFDVTIEPDSIRGPTEGWRLAHIMEERSPGKRRRTRLWQLLQQQQRVDKHIAFGMKLWGLFHTFHGLD